MERDCLSISNADVVKSFAQLSLRRSALDDNLMKPRQTADDSPSFPLEIFPERIRRILMAYMQYEGFNKDFICGSALVVMATALGNRWRARFSSTLSVSPILFLVLIGEPSSGKTPPLKEMGKPFQDADMESDKVFNKQMQEYNALKEMSAEDRRLQGLSETLKKPVHHEIMVIDSTVEKLFCIIKENPYGILLYINELSRLVSNLNRYGKGSDEAYYIELYDGSQVKYERKTSDDYINILHPYVSIIGGTQPGLLRKMFGGDKEASGFASRFLKIFPDINHMPKWGAEQMPPEFQEDWKGIVNHLLKMECSYDENGEVIPRVLWFTDEAKSVLFDWQGLISEKWDNSDSYMKGVCGKLKTYIVRFCLIIHVMRIICGETTGESIDAISAKSACLLCDYFFEMDKRVHNMVCAKPVDSTHQTLFDGLPDNFTTADAVTKGSSLGISERTVKRFLSNGVGIYLKKDKHGIYSKKE